MGTGSKCEMWLNSEGHRINSFAIRVNVNAATCQSKNRLTVAANVDQYISMQVKKITEI